MSSTEALPVGTRVRVKALRSIGSAALLNGTLGTVIGEHHIARNWIVIRLDPNPLTRETEWPIAAECVEIVEGPDSGPDRQAIDHE